MERTYKPEKHFKRNIFGGVVGNILEWYDFAIFGYFAPVIGAQFFPSADPVASLINAFGVFAAGYLMRPVGGAIFGHFGDRIGRKMALQVSVIMMAVPTTLVAFLPTHAEVGIIAPLLLVLLRLAQGISVGGELIGSISFVTEIAPQNRKGFFGSLSICSAIGGILLGSAVATLAHFAFDQQFLNNWGWRIPFGMGFLIGAFGLWMREGMIETPEFEKLKQGHEIKGSPVLEVVKTMPGKIVHIVAMMALYAGGFYMLFVWWPTYLSSIVKPAVPHAYLVNTIAMFVLMFLIPAAGWLSDLFGRKMVLSFGLVGIIVTSYPLVAWTDHGTFSAAIISQVILAVFLAAQLGTMSSTLVELFPAKIRFSGIGVAYNMSLAIFGGTAPLVSTWIISKSGDIATPAYYLIAMSITSLIATLTIRKSPD